MDKLEYLSKIEICGKKEKGKIAHGYLFADKAPNDEESYIAFNKRMQSLDCQLPKKRPHTKPLSERRKKNLQGTEDGDKKGRFLAGEGLSPSPKRLELINPSWPIKREMRHKDS